MANDKVDVVIVGAGASGSVFAAVLAKAGKKVVVLEQGPDWQLTDLISSDFWGRRIKPAGGPFLLEGKNPFGYVYQAGWGVGGAALHYFANFPRLLPNDFKIKSEHGRALDWPISYSDVAPYYDKVAQDVGVSGDAKAEEIWRPAGEPYPMPPMKTFRHGEVWRGACEEAGIRLVPEAVIEGLGFAVGGIAAPDAVAAGRSASWPARPSGSASRRLGLKLTIVLLNNDGGGIFHFLPVAGETDAFEQHVATPHGLEFARAAELYGLDHTSPDTVTALRDALARSIERDRATIIEVSTDREANLALHRRVAAAVLGS